MRQCLQYKENGERCRRPAMKNGLYCYHHEVTSIGTDRDDIFWKDNTTYFDDNDSFVTENSDGSTDDTESSTTFTDSEPDVDELSTSMSDTDESVANFGTPRRRIILSDTESESDERGDDISRITIDTDTEQNVVKRPPSREQERDNKKHKSEELPTIVLDEFHMYIIEYEGLKRTVSLTEIVEALKSKL